MCKCKSGIAVRLDETTIRVYQLDGEDSHNTIRQMHGLTDSAFPLGRYQTPIELVPVRGLAIGDCDFVFDAGRPDWWTDDMTRQATTSLYPDIARLATGEPYGGDLYLHNLTSLPEGASLSAGGHLDLGSLTSLPDGASLSAGGYLDLGSLTSLPEDFDRSCIVGTVYLANRGNA